MTLPWRSANTCISMWRGAVTYFSISTRGSPNADCASRDGAFQRGIELGVLVDAAHALAAAARHRLDQHRVADLVGLLLEEFRVLQLAVIAGHHRHAGLLHQRLGLILQAHGADRGRRRPDEHDAGGRAGFGELRVLRTGSRSPDGCILRLREARDRDQLLDREIAFARRPAGRSDAPRRPRARAARPASASE